MPTIRASPPQLLRRTQHHRAHPPHRRIHSAVHPAPRFPSSPGKRLRPRPRPQPHSPYCVMADPFEVRQRFTTLLSHLSASHTSIQKAVSYALKNRDMDEDLHSCILEQLERTNMNTRANIMFFIESLCEMAVKDGAPSTGEGSAMGFVRMLQRDILPVVECVIGEEGANVRVVRKVLNTLQKIDILLPETVSELEAVLKTREPDDPFDASPANNTSTKNAKLDKRQIEHRIEEDRERHKRLRESIWAVPGEGEEEMHKLWEEASDIGEDDYIIGKEDKEERDQAIAFG